MTTLEEEIAAKKAKLAQLQGQAPPVPQAIPPEAIDMVLKVLTEQGKSVFAEVLTEEIKKKPQKWGFVLLTAS